MSRHPLAQQGNGHNSRDVLPKKTLADNLKELVLEVQTCPEELQEETEQRLMKVLREHELELFKLSKQFLRDIQRLLKDQMIRGRTFTDREKKDIVTPIIEKVGRLLKK